MSQTLRELIALVASAPQAAKRSLQASPSSALAPPSQSPRATSQSPSAVATREYTTLRLPSAAGRVSPEQENEQAKMDAFVFFTMMR